MESKITTSTINIPLLGVKNVQNALIIENGLAKISHIKKYTVDVKNSRVIIEADDLVDIVKKAVAVIRELGFNVGSVKTSFPVTGLSCASCAINVENTLGALKGVIASSVNFANSTTIVEYIPEIVNPHDFKQNVQSAGYDIFIEDNVNTDEIVADFQKSHLSSLKLKTILSVVLSTPIVIIGMFYMNMPYANYIMWVLSTIVLVFLGQQFYVGAWKQAKHKSFNMDTLVALSTGTAYIFSVFNTLFPEFWHKRGLNGHVYFEASAVIITFILLGKLLEENAKANTSSAIKKLIGLQPKTVTIVYSNGETAELPISQVKVGDILQVKPGDKIAVDGFVTSGSSYVDESMISGEPIPVIKETESKVYSGTINQKGSFLFKAEKVGGNTLLAQIIKMVLEAQGSKAPVQKLVDKVAGIFVPVVIAIALLSFVLWISFDGENRIAHGLMSLVTVLVIACPCALGLATPTAIMVGVGKGAENGILIKDAESLELSKKINAIVLDKTGTITEGKPELRAIEWEDGNETDILISILYSIEMNSEHPLAESVTRYLNEKKLKTVQLKSFESITGKGVTANYDGCNYFVGNNKYIEDLGIKISDSLQIKANYYLSQANTVIWFTNKTNALAFIAITDKIKIGSTKAIDNLKTMGIDVYMMTGDNTQTAKLVAEKVGITNYKANMLPADKADFIKMLQKQGKIVAMVGDGINDSHALAQADIGIAMGKGADIAMDVAKMVLISSDLNQISKAIILSKKTVSLIRQNLFWAFIYNIIGIPIAAGILFPINGFLLNPMIAGATMALSSVSVVSNSLRLKFAKL